MAKWPKDNEASLDAFYTRPDGSAKWEVTNLVYIFPPWKIYIPETTTEMTRGIRVHKLVAESLKSIFAELWKLYPTQEEIEKVDLHKIGGAYYFRPRRGSRRLSNHARGIAIDIDPLDNPMKKGSRGDMETKVIDVFTKHGWRWGGVYGDPMHFEAVDNGGFKPFNEYTPPAPAVSQDLSPWVDAATPVIKLWESFRAKRYWDVKQWAIGYGQHATGFTDADAVTEEQASEMLKVYLNKLAPQVAKLVTVPLTANQGGALLSFAYNLGVANLAVSTLLKKLNTKDYNGAADQFQHWVKATINGERKVLPGLVKRRNAEKQLFLKDK